MNSHPKMGVLALAAAFVFSGFASVSAQTKRKTGGKTTAKAGSSFQIYTDKGGKYRFRMLNSEGTKLAMAIKGYKTKKDISDIVSAIKSNAARASVDDQTTKTGGSKATKAANFQVYKDKGGKYRFRLVDGEGTKLAMAIKGYVTKKEITDIVSAIRSTASRASITDDSKKS